MTHSSVESMEPDTFDVGTTDEYMNRTQRDHFYQMLTDWKQRLMEGVDTTVDMMKTSIQGRYADDADMAAESVDFNFELRKRDRERKLMRKIDKSMQSIAKDDYGYCNECGTEIGIQRLEARPTATLCIDCKTFSEIREKQGQGRAA